MPLGLVLDCTPLCTVLDKIFSIRWGVDNAYAFYISQVMKLAVQNYIGPLFFAYRK